MNDSSSGTSVEKTGTDTKEFGVRKGIYAAGYSFKDGLIWGTLAFVASIAVLGFGRKGEKPLLDELTKNPIVDEVSGQVKLTGGNFIAKMAQKLEGGHGSLKQWFKKGIENTVAYIGKLAGKEDNWRAAGVKAGEFATKPSTTAVAAVVSGVTAKVAGVSGAHRGWREAAALNKELKEQGFDNRQLKENNKLLAEDVERLNAALANMKRPDPAAEKETAASRGA